MEENALTSDTDKKQRLNNFSHLTDRGKASVTFARLKGSQQ